jgi:hypothetical protein
MQQTGEWEKVPKIRRLAALDALDEAIGRATEMGVPIWWTTGATGAIGWPTSVVSFAALSYIAKNTARRGTKLIVQPQNEPFIPIARQYVLDAYTAEGKVEDLDESYTFRYVAGGKIQELRTSHLFMDERVAAMVMISAQGGTFVQFLCAEASRSGTVVIAGTPRVSMLQFAAPVSDYCLIGEETFAFGAYLTEEPIQLGSVFAQDVMKYAFLFLLGVGSILIWAGSPIIKTMLGW